MGKGHRTCVSVDAVRIASRRTKVDPLEEATGVTVVRIDWRERRHCQMTALRPNIGFGFRK